jgi:Ala-tRNA(Pro) deacylase
MNATSHHAEPGDVIIVGSHTIGGASGVERRIGEILEVRGDPGRERYRVLWDDDHESIFVPSDDMTIRRHAPHLASVELMRELGAAGVGFQHLRHPRTKTAVEEAAELGRPPTEVAKTLLVRTSDANIRVVVPASERLALSKLRRVTEAPDVRLATEAELAELYPDFELGALPPFGGPAGDRVIVDAKIAAIASVVVEAGSQYESLRIATADLIRLTNADVADVVDG